MRFAMRRLVPERGPTSDEFFTTGFSDVMGRGHNVQSVAWADPVL